jgi:hypothetical protein
MLQATGLGFGMVAWNALSAAAAETAANDSSSSLERRTPHRKSKARSVILLMQPGGPSHMDCFDPKPELNRCAGQVYSEKVEMFQPGSEANKLLGTPFRFRKHGQCGMDMSEAFTEMGKITDELCMIRSMYTGHNNHTEALVMITSGKIFPGRPTWGSWISYALGTENQNLPGYVVLRDPEGYPGTGATLWQNGWLPALYRGTEFRAQGLPVPNLQPAVPVAAEARSDDLAFLAQLNELHRRNYPFESVLEARIRNYELAARMQLAALQTVDLSTESKATRALYGLDQPATAGYGLRCLMARRLVEAGVRFVQVFPTAGNPWDSHTDSKAEIEKIAAKVDRPTAALIKDLKLRGLLEQTIVLWTGEFGRQPVSQRAKGRDHNRNAFTLLAVGGGFRAGYIHGATDEVGYRAVEKRVGVNDLFATVFHLLGIDHERLIYNHDGREETPTDAPVTGATVVEDLLA